MICKNFDSHYKENMSNGIQKRWTGNTRNILKWVKYFVHNLSIVLAFLLCYVLNQIKRFEIMELGEKEISFIITIIMTKNSIFSALWVCFYLQRGVDVGVWGRGIVVVTALKFYISAIVTCFYKEKPVVHEE